MMGQIINPSLKVNLVKTIFSSIVLGLILNVHFASAAAPSKISLSYDHEVESLHIDITHQTHDRNEHYIKKVVIYKNAEEPMILYFRQQVNPTHFIVDTPLKAKSGDIIQVEATDRQGGTKSEQMIVPELKTE